MTTPQDHIRSSLEAAAEYVPPADGAASPAPSRPAAERSARAGKRRARSRRGGAGERSLDLELAFLPLTDLGNAERFSWRNKGKLLYVAAIGWLAWDGRRWAREGAGEVVTRAVHQTVRAIQDEAAALADSPDDFELSAATEKKEAVLYSEKVAAWGRASEAASKLKPVSLQAAPYLTVLSGALDSDDWKINLLNGTLHVRRGPGEGDPITLHPHDPGDLITKLCPVAYDPEAACPNYDRFLADVQPDAAMRRFLHQWGGYGLTGDVGEQKLVFFYGKGKNGKSTLVDAWGEVSGDYGETIPIETFLDQGRGRNAGQATPDLAILPGIRNLRTSEPEKGAKLAEALIKLVTGGEPIQARHLNKDYFKFRPRFKLTMSGNYRPHLDGTDEGIWRRVVLVPWLVTVGEPDRLLPLKLKAEMPGILNRLLDGLRDMLDCGSILWPQTVIEATAAYREDSDPLGRFLAAAVVMEKGSRVPSYAMHATFIAWAKSAGEKEWTPKGLGMALRERGFLTKHSDGVFWLDCKLVKTSTDFATSGPAGEDSPAPPPPDRDPYESG